MKVQILIGVILTGLLSHELAHAEITTLFCSGMISAENYAGHKKSGQVATTVTFDEQSKYFVINDTGNMEKGAVFPYKKLNFTGSSIFWNAELEPLWGNGTFFGSIDRKTGEMTTHYLGMQNGTGNMVTIDGQFFCEKQVGNRF